MGCISFSIILFRLPNVIILNFWGKVPPLDVILVSSLPGRATYRPQFDLSIAPLFPRSTHSPSPNEWKDTLLISLVNVSGVQKQDVLKELGDTKASRHFVLTAHLQAAFIMECPKDSAKFCTKSGKKVELEQLIQVRSLFGLSSQ